MNERRLKFFISSTYKDLKSERNLIAKTLNRLGYDVLGMELFPAGRRHQWEVIKESIDKSDFIIVILKYRYGTIFKDDESYTECEIEYAVKNEIKIIPFISSKEFSDDKYDNKDGIEKVRKHIEKYTPKYFKSNVELLSELFFAIKDIENNPKKWGVSDKSSALKKLNNENNWVVDDDDIYYEPNSDFGIILEHEENPTDNWKNLYDTFQSDTILTKEIWERQKIKGEKEIDFQFNFFYVKIVHQVRTLKKFRINIFYIRHFPNLYDSGIYYFPAHEVIRNSLREKNITNNITNDSILELIKALPEYKVCKILFNNLKYTNSNSEKNNDFILKYLDLDFLKKILGLNS